MTKNNTAATTNTEVLIDIEDTSTTITESDIKHSETNTETKKSFFTTNKNTINFLAGGISGSVAAIATQPLDVLKTRFQSSAGIYNDTVSQNRFFLTKIVDSLKVTARNEGINGL